jgi:hypothetical protein
MTATQLRHAKLWFAGRHKNWDLAAYEINEIKEGLEDAARLFPTFEGIPVAEMIKTIVDPRIERLEKAVRAKSSAKFIVAFDERRAALIEWSDSARRHGRSAEILNGALANASLRTVSAGGHFLTTTTRQKWPNLLGIMFRKRRTWPGQAYA